MARAGALALLACCALLPGAALGTRPPEQIRLSDGSNESLWLADEAAPVQAGQTVGEHLEHWRATLKSHTLGQCVYPGNIRQTSSGCRTRVCTCALNPVFDCYMPPLQYGLALTGQCALADWVYVAAVMLEVLCCCGVCNCIRK